MQFHWIGCYTVIGWQCNNLSIFHMNYHTTCPECKNELEYERATLTIGEAVECEQCGMTLEVTTVDANGNFETVIVEEEK